MTYLPFPARLLAAYNSTEVFGAAHAAESGNAINFTGEFIPLLPLGSPACLHWISGERTLSSFKGKVYLSSPGLLRLVDVAPRLMKSLRCVFAQNTAIPAAVSREGAPPFAASVVYLSNSAVTLSAPFAVPAGAALALSAEISFLTLQNLALTVSHAITLKRGRHLLRCTVCDETADNRVALAAYTPRLSQI